MKDFWSQIRISWRVVATGICTAGIIATTISAMAFKGSSVFYISLITRGSVFLLAPFADVVSKNRIRPRSILACSMSIVALVLMHLHKLNGSHARIPSELILILVIYILCYAIKLPLISTAKRSTTSLSFLVSEQTVAVVLFCSYTLAKHGMPRMIAAPPVGIGIFSQLTGIFGGAVLISPSEHTASVPLNRASSMIAALIASLLLGQSISAGQWAGFLILFLVVLVLVKR